MKKILIIIALFIILIANRNEQEFSLADYFDGEYCAYTQNSQSQDSIDLGFCYLNKSAVNNAIGESMVIKDFEVSSAINTLDASVLNVEILDDGTQVIYCYSHLIPSSVQVDDKKVNLQIAYKDDYSVIGWPLILGSF